MQLNINILNEKLPGYQLPGYDVAKLRANTIAKPRWVHFGAGNIFRAMIAAGTDKAIESGAMDTGIIACAMKNEVEGCYKPHDDLCINVALGGDGSIEKQIIGCIAQALVSGEDDARLTEIFTDKDLQMVSFTITEKGYDPNGFLMGKIAEYMHARYQANAQPIALLSLDNCASNGAVLKRGVLSAAEKLSDQGFIDYLNSKVSFPWSMIDKITPRPDPIVQKMLEDDGFTDMAIQITPYGAHMAAFVNAEKVGYLAVQDEFPNGRPDLAACGFLMTDIETVEKCERMKVYTCLNPLHTALAVFGCLLGYERICEEMKDEDLTALINKLGWDEGMKVVTDPGILSPKQFLTDCIEQRFPNPFVPDTPQRIATDTSQKLGIRFGQTLKAYMESDELDAKSLVAVPLVFAGWLRYLTGISDRGWAFERSPDPMLSSLQPVADHLLDKAADFDEAVLAPVLKNENIFGVDLYRAGIADKVISYLREMLKGTGAIRSTLHREVTAS